MDLSTRNRVRAARDLDILADLYTAAGSFATMMRPSELELLGVAPDTIADLARIDDDPDNVARMVCTLGFYLTRMQLGDTDRSIVVMMMRIIEHCLMEEILFNHAIADRMDKLEGISAWWTKIQENADGHPFVDWFVGKSLMENLRQTKSRNVVDGPTQDEQIRLLLTYASKISNKLRYELTAGSADMPQTSSTTAGSSSSVIDALENKAEDVSNAIGNWFSMDNKTKPAN